MLHDLCSLLFVEREMAWQISQVHSFFHCQKVGKANQIQNVITWQLLKQLCHAMCWNVTVMPIHCNYAFSWSLNCTSIGALHNGFAWRLAGPYSKATSIETSHTLIQNSLFIWDCCDVISYTVWTHRNCQAVSPTTNCLGMRLVSSWVRYLHSIVCLFADSNALYTNWTFHFIWMLCM